MYVCVYVCMYVCMYVCVCACLRVCACLLFDTDPWQLRRGFTSLQHLTGGGRLKSLGFDMFETQNMHLLSVFIVYHSLYRALICFDMLWVLSCASGKFLILDRAFGFYT